MSEYEGAGRRWGKDWDLVYLKRTTFSDKLSKKQAMHMRTPLF